MSHGTVSGGVNTVPVKTDAANRAWRTFVQAFLLDVVTTAVVALAAATTDIHWTKEYWIGIAALLGKSVVLAAISYAYRTLKPPVGASR